MFAVVIAIVGLLGLFLSVIQTAYAIMSYRDSLEVARQSLEVSIQALNVSLGLLLTAATGEWAMNELRVDISVARDIWK